VFGASPSISTVCSVPGDEGFATSPVNVRTLAFAADAKFVLVMTEVEYRML
jgi:hypothetical protein